MIHSPLPIALIGTGVAVTAIATYTSYHTFVPRGQLWGPVVWKGNSDRPPRVALTFDDGPTAGATDRVLDLLTELNVKAAFFLIGRNVEREPDLARRIVADGHLVGNHTHDHSRWSALGRKKFWDEQIEKADAAIERAVGLRAALFRPPIGHKTRFTMAAARKTHHSVVTWSIRGWDGVATTSRRIVDHVLPRCGPGAIIVLHDGTEPGRPRDASATLGAIRPLVEGIRQQGLEPVRLDELTGLQPYA